MTWTLNDWFTFFSIIGLFGTWILWGFRKLFIYPRFGSEELFPYKRFWNIKVFNEEKRLGSNATNCHAKLDLYKVKDDGSTQRLMRGTSIVWENGEYVIDEFNRNDDFTLEVLEVFPEKNQFYIRHKKGDVSGPFDFGKYKMTVKITARELRKSKKILDKEIKIPDDLQNLPDA